MIQQTKYGYALGVEPKWIAVEGVRTRYFEMGSGEPILLITGGNFGSADGASVVETWEANFSVLAQRYRVVALDKIGQGHTGNPLRDDYTMQAVVTHAIAFMQALDLTNVHVVGQSRGAMAAVNVVRQCPERTRSCTIVNSSTLAPGVGLNEVVLSGCPFPSYSREAQRWNFEMCAYQTRFVSDAIVEAGYEVLQLPKYRESVMKMEEEGLKASLFLPQLARMKQETLHWLSDHGMGRPTQVIWGLNDKTATLDRAISLVQLIAEKERQTTFHVINEAGHHPYREHPEYFNEIMFGFLSTLR
jgi:2-hydroxy-6-oxonona-2,4-dienedioate hydrolase